MKQPSRQRAANKGLHIKLCLPKGGAPLAELRLKPGSERPSDLEMVECWVEQQLRIIYPAWNRHRLQQQMKSDPLYAAYEKARIDLWYAYPQAGVPQGPIIP